MCSCSFVLEKISVNKLILIQKATLMFWNELGHLVKPIVNTFVLIITINKIITSIKPNTKTKTQLRFHPEYTNE